jgi:uncharacterized damage-inducible protein DinB
MYYHLTDFYNDWEYESEATLKLFKNLTDESLDQKVHENVRTLGFLSWHIIYTIQEMMDRTGLKVHIKDQQDYMGESSRELVSTYEKGAKLLIQALKARWTDADLGKEDDMYGEKWKRGMTLTILIRHQAHHRAEMVVVMRMLGLPVVGIYGPVKEEWAQWGQEAMK